jgi:hypothetical protein
MVSLFTGHKRSIGRNEHVKTRIRDKNSGEVVDIHIERSRETKRGSQGRNNLRNKSVDILVRRTFDIKGSAAYIVKRFIVQVEGKIRILKKRVCREHSIVGLYNRRRYLRRGRNGKTHLGLTAEVNGKTLQEKRSKTGTSSSSGRVENEESLKSGTVITHLADLINDSIDDILSNRVVTTRVVISGVFLSADDRFRMVKTAVLSSADRVAHSGLEIDHDGTGHMLAVLSLTKEGVVGAVLNSWRFISGHQSLRVDTMLKAIELPTGGTYGKSCLSNVNADQFSSHFVGVFIFCDKGFVKTTTFVEL